MNIHRPLFSIAAVVLSALAGLSAVAARAAGVGSGRPAPAAARLFGPTGSARCVPPSTGVRHPRRQRGLTSAARTRAIRRRQGGKGRR